ncbi:uncharacterized protein [Arachis hypogaea]|uniref:uncharacterized protein n=1 Tax=Arachis hypogaea TaxID=3818 RepID=UPI003B20CDC6
MQFVNIITINRINLIEDNAATLSKKPHYPNPSQPLSAPPPSPASQRLTASSSPAEPAPPSPAEPAPRSPSQQRLLTPPSSANRRTHQRHSAPPNSATRRTQPLSAAPNQPPSSAGPAPFSPSQRRTPEIEPPGKEAFLRHTSPISRCCFSASGNNIASASLDGIVSVLYIKCSPVEPIFVSAAASGGIGLLAAGQSSTITGTYAGQFITEGFLKLNIKKWLRSLITRSGAIVPTMIAAIVFNTSKSSLDTMNEWLNVVQSIQIPFALIPLLTLVSKEEVMGTFRIGPIIEESFVCIITFVELILMYTDYVW